MLHDTQAQFVGDVFASNSAAMLPSTGSETVNFVTVKPVGVGGAVYQFRGRLNIVNGTFKNNRAVSRLGQGGALYAESAVTQLASSTLTGNWATYAGGAIRLVSKQCPAGMKISGSQLNTNSAQIGGAISAGVANSDASTVLTDDDDDDPALPSCREQIEFIQTAVPSPRRSSCSSSHHAPHLLITSSNLQSNGAQRIGGAVACNRCMLLHITSSNFTNRNAAGNTGGAISAVGAQQFVISGSVFKDCLAASGGAISLLESWSTVPDASSSTAAAAAGGGVGTSSNSSTGLATVGSISNCVFSSNAANPSRAHVAAAQYQAQAAAALTGSGSDNRWNTQLGTAGSLKSSWEMVELPACDEQGTGGALCVALAGRLMIDANTTFRDNFAHLGGASWLQCTAIIIDLVSVVLLQGGA
jgi:hypothetical protein